MRDLKNLYVRANTCVACHQNLDPEIRAAGHPELIFEMDGQSVTMPRHWPKASDAPGRDNWFVGQAVALREMSWQLLSQKSTDPQLTNRWSGLLWVLQLAVKTKIDVPSNSAEEIKQVQKNADLLARQIGSLNEDARKDFSLEGVKKTIQQISDTSNVFGDTSVSVSLNARRAERLVLALDRLLPELPGIATNSALNESLNKLFADAQSLPDFDPKQFAQDLNTFHTSVAGFLPTQ